MTQTHQQHRAPLPNRRETYTAVTDAAYTAKAGDQVWRQPGRRRHRNAPHSRSPPRPHLHRQRRVRRRRQQHNITLATKGSEIIDGAGTYTLSANYQAISLYSDGSNWFVVPVVVAGGGSGAVTR